jgi:alpha-tubulin suppressor-like RCC1 family protein
MGVTLAGILSIVASGPINQTSYRQYSQVSAGFAHTCAIDSKGNAWCWGRNSEGQLGTGNTTSSSKPVSVTGGLTFTDISAGGSSTCGISNKKVYCWGSNLYGQVGNGTQSPGVTQPTMATGITADVATVRTAGDYACALTVPGDMFCWGHNMAGELGLGSGVLQGNGGAPNLPNESKPTPLLSSSGQNLYRLALGGSHGCAVTKPTPTTPSTVLCWGDNLFGAINPIDPNNPETCPNATSWWPCRQSPVAITQGFDDVAVGDDYSCAINYTTYRAACWGGNAFGQLGIDPQTGICNFQNGMSFSCSFAPVTVAGLTGANILAAGSDFNCAARYPVQTPMVCWGRNFHGQLGDGTTTNRSAPTLQAVPLTALGISAGSSHGCVLTDGNTGGVPASVIYCWGNNIEGQVGNGNAVGDVLTPTRVVD